MAQWHPTAFGAASWREVDTCAFGATSSCTHTGSPPDLSVVHIRAVGTVWGSAAWVAGPISFMATFFAHVAADDPYVMQQSPFGANLRARVTF